MARRIFQDHQVDRLRTLRAWRGGWIRWARTHWAEMDNAELRSQVYKTLEAAAYLDGKTKVSWNPNRHRVANVIEAMAAVGHLRADADAPSWLVRRKADIAANEIISCANGLLHVRDRQLQAHTPAYFNTVSVPFDYHDDAPEPVAWLEFLASIWPDDTDSVALLQEFTGYVLSGRTDMQKALLLIGPTRSGKGTYARLLTALVGRGNAAGPTLASLGTNFGLSPLLSKPLAVVADARLGGGDVRTVVERLLSITGEDMLTVDRKFKEPWSGKLPSRFVILSNELPRFGDASGAIANRFLVLQMTNSFLGKEDRTLDARLTAELPGILSWALDGLDRIVRNGRFTVPAASHDATALMMDLASPISAFVRDCCVRAASAHVQCSTLYEAWKTWCEDNGHRPGSNAGFSRDLRAVVPELLTTRPNVGGDRVRRYDRIGLLSSAHNGESGGPGGPNDKTAGQDGRGDGGVGGPVGGPSIPLGQLGPPTADSGPPAIAENAQVNGGGPPGPPESAFKGVLKGEDQPVVRTPGRTVGQWIGSGEDVATVTTLPSPADSARAKVLELLADGSEITERFMGRYRMSKRIATGLPAALESLLASGEIVSRTVGTGGHQKVLFRLASTPIPQEDTAS